MLIIVLMIESWFDDWNMESRGDSGYPAGASTGSIPLEQIQTRHVAANDKPLITT
jgi:hypothetical protein